MMSPSPMAVPNEPAAAGARVLPETSIHDPDGSELDLRLQTIRATDVTQAGASFRQVAPRSP